MKVTVYSAHRFEKDYLLSANNNQHELLLIENRLTSETVTIASGSDAVCLFSSDNAGASNLEKLSSLGIKYIALRSAGFNHVDLERASELQIKVARVPEYSPYAIAEHSIALMLALNRKLIRAHSRISEQNFSLDGLTGFDMNGKTVGIIGTGKIGSVAAKILHGFGCRILAYDIVKDERLVQSYHVEYSDLKTLFRESDIITLHCPLNKETRYIINEESIAHMKEGVMLINTGRGALVKTLAVIKALKQGKIGFVGLDVYEEEEGLFFEDRSDDIIQDDVIARLMTFKNVLITSHQAFLTDTALKNISETTIYNLSCFEKNIPSGNEILNILSNRH